MSRGKKGFALSALYWKSALFPQPPAPASPWQDTPLRELRNHWDQAAPHRFLNSAHQEFLSLLQERDPDLLREGLLGLARRLRSQEQDELAGLIDAALGINSQPRFFESTLRTFAREALNPVGIAGMTAAGLAFRATRLGLLTRLLASPATGWTRGMGARTLAGLGGFLTEVPTLLLASKGLQQMLGQKPAWDAPSLDREWKAGFLFLGGMKIGAVVGGFAGAGRRPLLEQFALLGGCILGKDLEHRLPGTTPRANAWSEGLIAYFQGHVGGMAGTALFGGHGRGMEAVLDWHVRQVTLPKKFFLAAQAASTENHSPQLPKKLLEAIGETLPNGTRPYHLALEALQRLYHYDAANTSTGSLQNALWQNFFQEALRDPVHGESALSSALQLMAKKPIREDWLRLSQNFGYAARWRLTSENFDRKVEEIRNLATAAVGKGNFSPFQIDQAIAVSARSPYNKITLLRLRNLLAESDTPGKLRELILEESFDTPAVLRELRAAGLSGEVLAQQINGTAHTAYLEDLRVARKVVKVHQDIDPYLHHPKLREGNLRKLQRDFMEIWGQYPDLGVDAMLAFLARQHDPQARALLAAVGKGNLEMHMVSANSFDDYIRNNGLPANCHLSLFLKPRDSNFPSMLWLRDMPKGHSTADPETAFSDFSARVVATFHEWEHYRHFQGAFDFYEQASRPFDIRRMNREDRLASETMAVLEQLRWGIKYLDDDFAQVAQQMGENLAQFARNMADWGYFGNPR